MSILKTIYLQHLNGSSPNATLDANGNMTVTGTVVSSSPTGGMRNKIINGDMRIDQRNAGASFTPSSSSAGWSLDRWRIDVSQNSKLTVQQNAGSVTPPTGFSNYLGVTSSSSYSVAAGDYFVIVQPIEGNNVTDLNLGSSSGSSFTLSFWVRSSLTGTFTGAMNGGNSSAATYSFSYTITSANTWQKISITVPPTSLGSGWGTTNNLGIQIFFGLGCGSTYGSGTVGSWSSSFSYTGAGGTSIVGTSGATFYITGVQLESGTISTPFERRPYGTELALCQRYYTKSYSIDVVPGTSTTTGLQRNVSAGGAGYLNFPFPVEMRIAPTITAYNSTGTSGVHGSDVGNWTIVTSYISTRHYHAAGAVTSSQWTYGHYVASAEL